MGLLVWKMFFILVIHIVRKYVLLAPAVGANVTVTNGKRGQSELDLYVLQPSLGWSIAFGLDLRSHEARFGLPLSLTFSYYRFLTLSWSSNLWCSKALMPTSLMYTHCTKKQSRLLALKKIGTCLAIVKICFPVVKIQTTPVPYLVNVQSTVTIRCI